MARDVRSSIDCILQCKPWAFVALRGKAGYLKKGSDSEFLLEIYVDHKKVCMTDETGGVSKAKLRPSKGGIKSVV